MAQPRGTPAHGLWGATLGFFVGFAAVALFGPTAKQFRDVMHLSPLLVGILVAMPALSGSLLRIPFSAWVDTSGGRKPFLVLLGTSLVGMTGLCLVMFFLYPAKLSPSLYPLLLVLGLLSGCGIATFSVGVSQVAYWHPQKKQGGALGTYAGVGNLAPGVFSLLLPFALMSWGLLGSYLAWLLFLAAGTAGYAAMGRNSWYFQFREQGLPPVEAKEEARRHGQELFPAGTLVQSLGLSARIWKTWFLVAIYFTTFGGFIALTAWFPTYWESYLGASPVAAGMLTGLYSILTSTVRIAGGGVSDRLGGERTAILSLLAMLLGALMLTVSASLALSVAGAIVLALGMGVANAAVFKLVPQEVPQAVGGAAGWVGGLGAFGGFAIPPLLGLFVAVGGNTGYARGFLVYVILTVLSIVCAGVLRRSRVGSR